MLSSVISFVIGLLVFSHWVIDFITHPMGAILGGTPLPPDLPLFFNSSSNVGLGLYNHSFILSIVTDLGMLIFGIAIYVFNRIKHKAEMSPAYNQSAGPDGTGHPAE
jgi:hypothetical protein